MELESLSRRELQVLAKKHSIKANQRSADLVREIEAKIACSGRNPPLTPASGACSVKSDVCSPSSTPPVDLKVESERVISEINTEDKTWHDSAKKELSHLDNIWEAVVNSPVRKYGRGNCIPTLEHRKKLSLSLQSSGFTTVCTPPPLRRFRSRDVAQSRPQVERMSKAGDENDENISGARATAAAVEQQKSIGSRVKESGPAKGKKISSKLKVRKPSSLTKSRRMALAEEKFRTRLLKTRNG